MVVIKILRARKKRNSDNKRKRLTKRNQSQKNREIHQSSFCGGSKPSASKLGALKLPTHQTKRTPGREGHSTRSLEKQQQKGYKEKSGGVVRSP